HGGRGLAEEHRSRDDGEEAARDLYAAGRCVDGGEIADHRRREQDAEERQVPIGIAVCPDRERAGAGERREFERDDPLTRATWHVEPLSGVLGVSGARRDCQPAATLRASGASDVWRIELMNSSRSWVENRRWPPGVRYTWTSPWFDHLRRDAALTPMYSAA